MSRVRVVAVGARCESTYRWRWISEDCRILSQREFGLFYECVEDAWQHGHEVELSAADRTADDLLSGASPDSAAQQQTAHRSE